ncbi:hypothetical protein [Fusicatenibacter sp.]
MIIRLSAYHNVWWAMANEFDLFRWKPVSEWESNAETVCRQDPYRHLRSIHNCMTMYDHSKGWITHCSLQRIDLYRTAENVEIWRPQYGKPCVLDEIAYEGNLPFGWGNISGEEMTRRFWEAIWSRSRHSSMRPAVRTARPTAQADREKNASCIITEQTVHAAVRSTCRKGRNMTLK